MSHSTLCDKPNTFMPAPFPALFIGHGNPMNTLQTNANSQSWHTMAADLPRPRAVLVISAHWLTRGIAVTAMPRPETIHDFAGFPAALSEFQYPAPGDPQLAAEIASLLVPETVTLDAERGLDHGAWSVLAHLFPAADIPVLQLSLDATRTVAEHYELATRLRPLRDAGILILGSGNVVHNLRRMDWNQPEHAFDWATRFNDAVRQRLLNGDHAALFNLNHDDAKLAAPTPEHYWPLLYIAAQQQPGEVLQLFNDHIEYGSIGMMSCQIGPQLKAAA
jgi:4,5-DOPA dioxygenase extradiol